MKFLKKFPFKKVKKKQIKRKKISKKKMKLQLNSKEKTKKDGIKGGRKGTDIKMNKDLKKEENI